MPPLDLEAQDLLTPRGRLNAAALWPDPEEPEGYDEATVEEKLDSFIEQAGDLTTDVAAGKAYCNWRALDEVYLASLPTPGSITLGDEGGHTITDAQRAALKEERDAAYTEWLTLSAPVAGTAVLNQQGSASVPVDIRW